MSARRRYTIKCDGPDCEQEVVTVAPWVDEARSIATTSGFFKIGQASAGATDFCSQECEDRLAVLIAATRGDCFRPVPRRETAVLPNGVTERDVVGDVEWGPARGRGLHHDPLQHIVVEGGRLLCSGNPTNVRPFFRRTVPDHACRRCLSVWKQQTTNDGLREPERPA